MRRHRLAFLLISAFAAACGSSSDGDSVDAALPQPDAYVAGGPITVNVSGAFTAGTTLRDHYTGATATVGSDGKVTVTPHANGVVLLERDGAQASPFSWQNVTVYHAIVDRYFNGDVANDNSYGRKKDGQMEVGTFHGGDWKGLTSKLDHIRDLGVTALWISPIVEQVHGWTIGGTGDFKHYGYHGYYALDFTRLDANMGTLDELKALVDAAHARGIRVLCDVVLNHPGYATGADLVEYVPEVFKDGTGNAFKTFDLNETSNYQRWNDLVDYNSQNWKNWWSPKWIRAGFPGFTPGGTDDRTRQLSFLPDFKTESTEVADTPVLLTRKGDSGFVAQSGFTVRNYLVEWHADWVRQVGFDGFRVDTVKNVESASFKALKDAGVAALAEWKAANPSKKLDDAPFWTVAEYFPHGVVKDFLYSDARFDSVINFDFQPSLTELLFANGILDLTSQLEALYVKQATAAADPTFQFLSYASSHDTRQVFAFHQNNARKQRDAGTVLLMAPGGVEIYYGDESGRPAGPGLSDSIQSTRSDMNFAALDMTILTHWQKLGTFRKKHAAIGSGAHQRLDTPEGTYAFSRKLGDDAVVVIVTPPR